MRSLIALLILLNFSNALAKTDWCEFNGNFAKEYAQARTKLAQRTRQLRNNAADIEAKRKVETGRWRAKAAKENWPNTSLSKKVDEYFPDGNFNFVSNEAGKVFISPKNLVEGQSYKQIIYDTSGDYFRVEIGVVKNGKMKPANNWRRRYLGAHSEIPERPATGYTDTEWDDFLGKNTHFLAKP